VTLCRWANDTADANHWQHRCGTHKYRVIHVCVRFDMWTLEKKVFRHRMPCRLFNSYLCVGGACCLHLEGTPFLEYQYVDYVGRNLLHRNVGSSLSGLQQAPPKHRYLPIYKAYHFKSVNLRCHCCEYPKIRT
jgi:hypothetical protein